MLAFSVSASLLAVIIDVILGVCYYGMGFSVVSGPVLGVLLSAAGGVPLVGQQKSLHLMISNGRTMQIPRILDAPL